MKQFNPKQIKLLSALAGGLCYSGNDLGKTLSISRTAVWKQIKQLVELGVPIESVSHQGYRLTTPMILLNERSISNQLKLNDFKKPFHIHLFASLNSTNQFLKELPSSSTIEICCSEMQTEGRGRFGRTWYSPFGKNIYLSTRWHFDCDLSRLSGLSLIISLAVISALKKFGIHEHVLVKWPNDILWDGKKLCGSLIEIKAESNASADVVIGIGLNVNSSAKNEPSLENAWCSLYDICGLHFDRNPIIVQLIMQMHEYLQRFMTSGLSTFKTQWERYDYLKNKPISVSSSSGSLHGFAKGINDLGQLILLDGQGTTHYLSSGDTTLRDGL